MRIRNLAGLIIVILLLNLAPQELASANPYLAKPGEPVAKARVGTCAVTGGFVHMYAALDNRVFDNTGSQSNTSFCAAA